MFSPFRSHLHKSISDQNPPLRIGLLIDDTVPISFFAEVARDLQAAEFTSLCLIVSRKFPKPKKTLLQRIWGLRKRLTDPALRTRILYRMYCIFDEMRNPDIPIFSSTNISSLLSGVPALAVQPIEKGFSDYFSPEDLAVIKGHNLDVLVRFGFRILRGEILQAAKYGIWSYHHGDQDFYRGSPAYFWEMVEGATLQGAILQIINEKLDDGRLIVKGRYAPQSAISMLQNRISPYLGSQHFVIDQLRRLHGMGWEHFAKGFQAPQPFLGKRAIYRAPTNREMLNWSTSVVAKKIRRRLKRNRTDRLWQIGLRKRDSASLEHLRNGLPESDYVWLKAPKGHFWADPMLLDHDGKTFLFYEDYSYRVNSAVLACAQVNDNFELINHVTVLDLGSHASFPFVFRDGNEIYMVPETTGERIVSLYQAVEFPHKWKKVKTLLDFACVDTVLWQQDGRWWMHTAYNFNAGHHHTALLFYSDSLLGQWHMHPQAPFAPDVRFARNGGPIFKAADGTSLRVSQSSEFRYGSSYTFFKIDRLTPTEYSETPVMTVRPRAGSGITGTHSYSTSQHFEAVDAVWEKPIDEIY